MKESDIKHYFKESSAVIESVTKSIAVINRMAWGIYESQLDGGKLLIAGNGGSCAQAEHFAGEMRCTFADSTRRAFSAISLVSASAITAWSNDFGFDGYFTRQVEAFGQPEDVLFLISTGGGEKGVSMNLVDAGEKALEMGLKLYSIVGKSGGELAKISHECIIVPSYMTSHIQEAHIAIIHAICEYLDNYSRRKTDEPN